MRAERAEDRGWTESELERRAVVEAGGTVIANQRADEALRRWAQGAGRLVRIDRRSRWGNPFKLGRDGDRSEVIALFAAHLNREPSLIAGLEDLRGKVLACWCHPERCHGEVLIEALARDGGGACR